MEFRQLIIHADDFGICHSVNEATIQALKKGIVTSASIMIPCPWVLETVPYARENPEADLGVHTTLTSEWKFYRWGPIASKKEVPGLLDPQGYLWPSVEEVVLNASPEEVEIEIRAQVKRAIDLGIRPTHIDTHMGTVFASPGFFETYFKVAQEFSIPPMVPSPNSEIAKQQRESNPELEPLLARLKELSGRFFMLDELVMGVTPVAFETRREEYKRIIKNLKPGITQIIVHLSLDSPEMRAVAPSEGDQYQWLARHRDFVISTDPGMKRFIDEQHIQLIGWKDLS